MPLIALLFNLVVVIIRAYIRKSREAKAQPLCAECSFASIQFGANGRRTISCTYGGGLRLMKLDVLYCSDYSSRDLPPRKTIGFVKEIAPSE
ncbi:MAG: hypothetical protein NVS1B11_25760 [Terriglobales bacterium]